MALFIILFKKIVSRELSDRVQPQILSILGEISRESPRLRGHAVFSPFNTTYREYGFFQTPSASPYAENVR